MSSINVSVINDTIVEGSEQFDLMLNVPSSLGPSITTGGRDTAVGIITDSTSKCGNITYSLHNMHQSNVRVVCVCVLYAYIGVCYGFCSL